LSDEPRFPYRFDRTHTLAQLRAEYDDRLVAGDTRPTTSCAWRAEP
jgi:hypothetical protein